jgi:putative oxidoreductase
MDVGLLILRVVVGLLMIGHGTQKLFGWFEGPGLDGAGGFFESLGFRPGKRHATLAGFTEAGAGVLLVLGFLTPLACAALIGVMVNVILAAHAQKGLWNSNGGFEFPLVLLASAAALAFTGAGDASLDSAFDWRLSGGGWGVAAVAVGLLTGLVVVSMRRTEPQPVQESETAVSGQASVTGADTSVGTRSERVR